MKSLKFLIISLTILVFCSCVINEAERIEPCPFEEASLYDLMQSYDLWYIDIHRTEGDAEVPFLQRAFTVSFQNGRVYANNNIVDVGINGNGFGVKVGSFDTYRGRLETSHNNGHSDFRVVRISRNEIRLDDINQDVSYYLVGHMKQDFNYDKLFYDNIEYFLQEYVAWERVTLTNGQPNIFDKEHYLHFTPENDGIFRSSEDPFGIPVSSIKWHFTGDYEVMDYQDSDMKQLTLYYLNNDFEKFSLEVLGDQNIRLIHLETNTIYDFEGLGFIQYLRVQGDTKTLVNTRNRKRRKIIRMKVVK